MCQKRFEMLRNEHVKNGLRNILPSFSVMLPPTAALGRRTVLINWLISDAFTLTEPVTEKHSIKFSRLYVTTEFVIESHPDLWVSAQ